MIVCLVINGAELPAPERLVSRLKKIKGMAGITFSSNTARTNVILGDNVSTVWGRPYITDCIGPVKYRISPLSFYQVNPVQTKRLYETAPGIRWAHRQARPYGISTAESGRSLSSWPDRPEKCTAWRSCPRP